MYQNRNLPQQIISALVGGVVIYLVFTLTWTIGYQLVYAGKIFPGVSVAGVDLSGLTPDEAVIKLSQTLSYPHTGKILFRYGDKSFVASPAELGMVFDPSASAREAYEHGRTGGLFEALAEQIGARGLGADVSPVILFDQRVAYGYLQNIAVQIDQPVIEAKLYVEGTNVVAQPGQVGRLLSLDATIIYLGAQLQSFRDGEVPLVVLEAAPVLVDVSSQAEVARKMLSQPLRITIPNYREGDPGPWTYDVPVVANMLAVAIVDNAGKPEMRVGLDPSSLRRALNDIKVYVDRQPSNAQFTFNDSTGQIEPTAPSKIGRDLDVEASILAINTTLAQGGHDVTLIVNETQPQLADTASGADLGIVELVAEETTFYYGSSEARIQNIKTAAERFDGVLVAPGEIFSMGSALGDVSLENGFAEALIIYGGRTIKGVGGGVCQVSTTLFRTVFFAGFPVIERYSHAYRVPYYEMDQSGSLDPTLAGMDATVYFPLVDFKFRNDTPYWMLMETDVNVGARTLTWRIYSTSDGREVTWETTGVSNVVPAPPPIFEVNTELKQNEIKQVDYAANGADVTVNRTVWLNGQVYFSDVIQTHYEPWSAVCEYGPETNNVERKAFGDKKCLAPSS